MAEFIHFLIDSQSELVATTYITLSPPFPVPDCGGEKLFLEAILVVFLEEILVVFLEAILVVP